MSKKITNKDFLKKVEKLYPNNDYSFLEEYVDCKTKLKVRHNCDKCNNYEFMSAPSDFLQGYGCPKCAGHMRKTQEQFIKEVFEAVGNKYTVLGTYKNGKTKILMRHNCDKCNNYEWETIPKNFLINGTRCPKCAGNIKLTHKEFVKKIKELVGNEFSVIGNYKNIHTKVKMRHNCKTCNNFEWEVKPSDFFRSPSCLKCSGRKKKTTDEFKQEVYDLVKNEYTVLNEYKNAHTKIKIRHNCEECNNYEYEVKPNAFLNGCRCPKCAGLQLRTQEEFESIVFNLTGTEYTVLSKYKNTCTKIRMKHNCLNCNNFEWEVTPTNFIFSKSRCPECFATKKKTTEEFKQEVYDLVKNEYTILDEYKNAYTKIKIRHNCKNCNNFVYEVSPKEFLRGERCPKCNESKGEKTISNYLDLNNINYKTQYKIEECKNINALPFDFIVFDKNNNLLGIIEYDGQQHFEPIGFGSKNYEKILNNFKSIKLRDSIKTKYCEDNNIPLLRIKYTQFKNIETILNHFLTNPSNYIKNHSYGMTNEEYYKEIKVS